jgi:uncharacterized protein YggE
MRSYFKIIPAVLLLSLTAPALAQSNTEKKGIIDIQAAGEVVTKPDMAQVTSGVVTDGETARDALSANTAAMEQLVDILKQAGIEDRDIQTSNFSVSPRYVYSNRKDANGYDLPPKIVGYQVSNNVSVRVRDLAILGQVLDKAVTVGANTISNINFGVSDTSELLNTAREQAMANAVAKAKLYAKAAGVELGRVMTISEQGGSRPQVYAKAMRASSTMSESAPVPVQGGELTYSINVSVRWELDQ